MSPDFQELNRPLGQNGGPATVRRPRFDRATLLTGLLCCIVLAASLGIALRDRPFRQPAVAVLQKEAAPAASKPDQPRVEAGHPREGQPNGAPVSSPSVVVIRDPSALVQNQRVAHLPDPALIENSDYGQLPVRAADGRRPFDVYARPWSGMRGARVAIVLGGLAVSQTGTQQAISRLPAEVTLAFSPHGNSIGRWMQAARRKGHEIVMQVPLEPYDFPNQNPGRHTLTVSAEPSGNLEDLRWALGRTTNYTGIMNYMGARFVADADAMATVMEELSERGLLYLDDGSAARSVAAELALQHRVPFAAADTTIDAQRDHAEILKKLDELERIARAKGMALGVGSVFDETVDAVAQWVAEAKRRGIEIVPVSALANDPERGG